MQFGGIGNTRNRCPTPPQKFGPCKPWARRLSAPIATTTENSRLCLTAAFPPRSS